ncbi:SDR family oxidoreductase [Actinoplanes sp. NPDC026619]|uniref:SDR family oxidoreductase n=1 Tax=Actinoplanes sp. NPDC026619 TaxID=3155798 RepID=UPI0033D2F9A2
MKDQTVVVIGGSAGIGLETARLTASEGAAVLLVGRDSGRLERAAAEVHASATAAFDAHDAERLEAYFAELPGPVDHVLVTAGRPYYGLLADMDIAEAAHHLSDHVALVLRVARAAVGRVRPGGTLIFIGGTGARRPSPGLAVTAAMTAALPALVANLSLEIAPIRINLIAAGFVDTPLSAALLGDGLEQRREQLRATLPIGRVVGPADVAALALHLMSNTALTGAVYDIDGGQQFLPG